MELGSYLRANESLGEFMFRCSNVTYFDCSEEEMLLWTLGPKRLPLAQRLPVTLLLLGIFVSGVLGNACVCVVIVRHPAMRTPTNCHLFNLAISDLLLLLFGLPNDLSMYWHQYPYCFGAVFCKLRALVSEASSYVSVLTLLAFSLQRCRAVCRPLQRGARRGLQGAARLVACLWLASLLAASPFALYTRVHFKDYPPGSGNVSLASAFCAMLDPPTWPLCELSSLLFFLLPGLAMLVLYAKIGLVLRAGRGVNGGAGALRGVAGSVHGEARRDNHRRSVRMLAAVVAAFFACWAPFHAQRLFAVHGAGSEHYLLLNEWLFSVAGVFYYVSATVNPILYNIMSRRYRTAFRETLLSGRRRSKRSSERRLRESSVRETTVQHTPTGGLVRLRPQRDHPPPPLPPPDSDIKINISIRLHQ